MRFTSLVSIPSVKLTFMKTIRSYALSWLLLLLPAMHLCAGDGAANASPLSLTLLSFNGWGLGAHTGDSIDQTIRVLRLADADIVGLQETRAWEEDCVIANCEWLAKGRLSAIASTLGYHYYENSTIGPALSAPGAILSRFPIVEILGGGLGVAILVGEQRLHAWNIHPTDFPYQPYQLMGIDYGGAAFLDTAEDAISAAVEARGEALRLLFEMMGSNSKADLDVVFGDFNEPSHHDWSERAVEAGYHRLVVEFPQSRAMEEAGFIDAYRHFFPDEIKHPGFTWTPVTERGDPDDHHDRIDFVYVRGSGISVTEALVIGESAQTSDMIVAPWPSDHRGVMVSIELSRE